MRRLGRASIKHGAAVGYRLTPEYKVWMSMRARCLDLRAKNYSSYGARGIGVCTRWDDFANFLADMGERPSKRHSIERINNDKGYAPENCRWASAAEQNRNRRNNRWITFNGATLVLSDWADRIGINRLTLRTRLENGWPLETALSPQLHKRGPKPALAKRRK